MKLALDATRFIFYPLFIYYSCSSSSGKVFNLCVCVSAHACMLVQGTFTSLSYPQFGCISILNWEFQVSGLGWSRPYVGYGFWTTDQTYCTARCNAENWWEADTYVFCNISQRDTGKYSAHPFIPSMPYHMYVLQYYIEKMRENSICCHILIIS